MGLQIIQQKLLVVVLLALLAINYPLLMLASHQQLIFGIPTLTLYLFGVWALLIVIVRHLIRNLQQSSSDSDISNTNA